MTPLRKILHLDLDAFFCAVEEQRDPNLRGKAFAVGGQPEQRGVVASCSYPARAQGVHSAMPMAQAIRKCPGLLIVPARHSVYGEVSNQVMARLHTLTPYVEQLSIDEAWLDVTTLPDEAEEIARGLQARILTELGLSCSLGVATNKLLAKVANNVGKATARRSQQVIGPPNAITIVPPGQEAAFLAPLPCTELWGVGPRTADRLMVLGIRTIGELARRSETELVRHFGKSGADLLRRARGIDDAPIITQRERKSVSQETTFARDVADPGVLRQTLFAQAKEISLTLKRKGVSGSTVKLKIRWADFHTLTRQATLAEAVQEPHAIFQAALALLEKAWDGRPLRLIGVGISHLSTPVQQATLFDAPDSRRQQLDETLRSLRGRFGEGIVRSVQEKWQDSARSGRQDGDE